MKKLILVLVFATGVNFASAQDAKPTKEETQKFITNMISQVIGKEYNLAIIKDQSFNNNFTEFATHFVMDDNYYEKNIYKNIKWWDVVHIPEARGNKSVTELTIYFNSKIEHTASGSNTKTSTGYDGYLSILIPVEKLESCKKAFLRLKEIAEEENKDPFQN